MLPVYGGPRVERRTITQTSTDIVKYSETEKKNPNNQKPYFTVITVVYTPAVRTRTGAMTQFPAPCVAAAGGSAGRLAPCLCVLPREVNTL